MDEPPSVSELWFRARALRDEHRAERDDAIKPSLDRVNSSTGSSADFARDLVKYMGVLNGGGLLAIPATLSLLRLQASDHRHAIFTVSSFYIAGLFCGALASFSGFMAFSRSADAYHSLAVQSARVLGAKYMPDIAASEAAAGEEAGRRAQTFGDSYLRWRAAGILAIIVSMVAFVAGTASGVIGIVSR